MYVYASRPGEVRYIMVCMGRRVGGKGKLWEGRTGGSEGVHREERCAGGKEVREGGRK